MRSIYRKIVVLLPLLALAVPLPLTAQANTAPVEPAPAAETAEAPAPDPEPETAEVEAAPPAEGDLRPTTEHEVRNQLRQLLRRQPRSLGPVLVMEPRLLANREFLDGYPALRDFLAAHPEVADTPGFYLEGIGTAHRPVDPAGALLEGLAVFGTFSLVVLALGWLIRTFIEQKRWNRLSKNQIDVHNRILDRFGSSEELLEYARTSAGTRFLEAAPIAVRADRGGSPQARIVRSVQIGVVIACAALGMLLISGNVDQEGAQVLFALGAISLSVGVGFVASAAVSNVLSRRFGLWEPIRHGEHDESVP